MPKQGQVGLTEFHFHHGVFARPAAQLGTAANKVELMTKQNRAALAKMHGQQVLACYVQAGGCTDPRAHCAVVPLPRFGLGASVSISVATGQGSR